MRKVVLGTLTVVFVFSLVGCNTLHGTAKGTAAMGKCIADGMEQDYKVLKKADEKFQEKYW